MYDIDFKNLKKGIGFGAVFLGIGMLFLIIMLFLLFTLIKEGVFFEEDGLFLILFFILPLTFCFIGFKHIQNIYKRIKIVKHLNEYGKLVKGIPYKLETTGMSVNNYPVLKPVVNYQLPNGQFVRLEGDPRHDFKERDSDGLVDMVIDEVNPEWYFIDFEINRYSGNRKSDYYVENGVVVEARVPESELNQHDYNFNKSSSDDYNLPYKPL